MKPGHRRILHRLWFAAVALVTLVALFYAEEDWRGARAWDHLRRELAARGESLDWHDFIPPPVPDDQNLAMAPLFARAFRYQVDLATGLLTFDPKLYEHNPSLQELNQLPYGRIVAVAARPQQPPDWQTGHRTNLGAWQAFYQKHAGFPQPPRPGTSAEDVLLALTRYGPLLDELARSAAGRPQTRFPIEYTRRPSTGIRLPHVSAIQTLVLTLRLRASARLALGQTAEARRDVALAWRLNAGLANEPILISALVNALDTVPILQPVWEGLQTRQWSAADLETLQAQLRGLDVLRTFQEGIRGSERAAFIGQLADELQRWSYAREWQMGSTEAPRKGPDRLLWSCLPILPRGWYAQNAALACRCFQAGLIDAADPANHRVMRTRGEETARQLTGRPVTPYDFLARALMPPLATVVIKFAQAQTAIDQAMTACALERYFLDHQAYPAALDALVPGYLDRVRNDVIDGVPLRYRLTSDGRYQLWSVAWDGQDDRGSIDWPADRQWRREESGRASGRTTSPFPNPERKTGDWVWQYTPAEPPDPPVNRSRLE